MFNSILVICTGNICRSPIGERLLQDLLPQKKIDSAGTRALVGHPADESAINIAKKNDLFLDGHKGKQFTAELGRQYDLLLVMEKKHIKEICQICPELRGKIMLFAHWIGERDVPDPYRKSDEAFLSVYQLIAEAADCWVEKLSNN
ncbi:TPA: protein tyrosine phosphatase [Escherichia coli]|nr:MULTISPECIES: protein tyrosine phosphatase [Enterobacteriaceae]HBZ7859081.1 protein tyrosine phosphatase [Klebsiella variicola subsp. variicola]EEY0839583.1 protein tyrosine phosphatase [Escherichia coli]EIN4975888.1 protein tyrosine phosphatase [Escherichia coli]EIS3416919.1 protein tyrosine phosphatase [Escherichia coli]EMC2150991.1 protein tyrosine phosphatase [Escherichia coli]